MVKDLEAAREEAARGEAARGEAARGEAARGEAARGEAATAVAKEAEETVAVGRVVEARAEAEKAGLVAVVDMMEKARAAAGSEAVMRGVAVATVAARVVGVTAEACGVS